MTRAILSLLRLKLLKPHLGKFLSLGNLFRRHDPGVIIPLFRCILITVCTRYVCVKEKPSYSLC
jgi:hypothetical protein